jgi:pimeloyl-ACP methyl ester carboxylesterase
VNPSDSTAAANLATVETPDGSRIAVHDLGGEGEPLVFVHATGLHGWVFGELAGYLQGFRCYSLDLRGHGSSVAAPSWQGSWDGFAQDLLAVVAGLDLHRPFAFGHSCGGATCLLAEEARPGTFRGLYCYEAIVRPFLHPLPPSADNVMSQGALRRRPSFPSKLDALLNYSSKPPLNALSAEALRAYVEHGFEEGPDGQAHLRCDPATEALTFANALSHHAFAALPDIACPVHLACGGRTDADEFGEPVARMLAGRLASGGREPGVTVFPRLGHFGPLQQPSLVAEDIAAVFSQM